MTGRTDDALEAAAAVLGDRARRDVALGPFTTYRVGGPAALFLADADQDDLHLLRAAVAVSGLPVLVVGRGSNLLVADAGFAGIAVTLGDRFADIQPDDEPPAPGGGPSERRSVRAGGAMSLPVLARRTAALGLRGFEWAVGVPGSVGGAVRMNAGGHGSDMRTTLTRAWVFDLAAGAEEPVVERVAVDLDLRYRHSAIRPAQVVVAAEVALTPGDRIAAEEEIAGIVRWRRRHQPGGANAGSVFANPDGDSAGRLIDVAGLRGYRRGSASISAKHANFVQVDEGGSATDVRALVEEIRAVVLDRLGVELALENHLIGFATTPSSGG